MNKKITVRNEFGKIRYCVLDGNRDFEQQLNEWQFGSAHPNGGICVCFHPTEIQFVDYFHADPMATFPILSIEDTDEDVAVKWIDVK